MPGAIERLGLQRAITLVFGAAAAAGVVAVTAAHVHLLRSELEAGVERQGLAAARLVAAHLPDALLPEGAAQREGQRHLEAHLGDALREPDDAYLVVLRADRRVLARAVRPQWAPRLEAILAEHQRRPADAFFEWEGLYMLSLSVRGGPGEGGHPVGYVLRGLSADRLGDRVAQARNAVAAALALAGAALAAALVLLVRRLVAAPLFEMGRLAARVSELDLSARAEPRSGGELGALAGSLNRIVDAMAASAERVRGVAEGVNQVIERVSRTGAGVAEGADTVAARVAETGRSLDQMLQSLKGIAADVEALAQGAGESSSSSAAMAATNDEVAVSIGQLAGSAEETAAAIGQMTQSIKEVAQNVEELSSTAEQTSFAMNQMDGSIGAVESNATETSKLSEQAARDAESGAEAIARTLAGIEKIRASQREAGAVLGQLGEKIGAIGNILDVIDDVADQTNLLALNAAILAAQSGEHGKGFAVVADEIKDLAERTGASTKEISDLIRSVQDQSQEAIAAMERGSLSVEEGVRIGQEAETALKKIQASSQRSTQMVKAIAQATLDQARSSRSATAAARRIAETAQQIASATAEQARGSEQIVKSAEKMKGITKQVERSSQEQARGSKQTGRSIGSIGEMVSRLSRAQKEQARGAEAVLAAVRQIREVAEAQRGQVRELEAAIRDLGAQAEVLRAEARRFRT
ncbi:MAG TPA: methyl-accepting chemotaxis protein [Anaeromyxobacteraceae bacterium]